MKHNIDIEGFGGGYTLPDAFTGKLYKAWVNAARAQDGEDDSEWFRREPHWRSVCAVGTVDITTPSGERVTNETAFDDVDLRVVNWCFVRLSEYLEPFLALPTSTKKGGSTAED